MSARIIRSVSSLALLLVASGCASAGSVDVPIEVRSTPTLDVSAFQRVLVAGFVVGGTTEIDANEETVRLLRSQLRSKTSLRVIDSADVLPLTELAMTQRPAGAARPAAQRIEGQNDPGAYEPVFANAAYWKRLGEEYQAPLIVTGTVLFTAQTGMAFVRRDSERSDSFGRHIVLPRDPVVEERTACTLRSRIIFIDGRTGAPLYSAVFQEAVSYDGAKSVPALSGYFELMDRILPGLLGTVSTQRIRTTRVLLQ
jgi:hypothetical protein